MSPQIRNLSCLGCGGVLDRPEGATVAGCAFCRRRHVVDLPPAPRWRVALATGRREAGGVVRDALRRLGRVRYIDGRSRLRPARGFAATAQPAAYQLYYVPFFRYTGLKLGTAPHRREDRVATRVEWGEGEDTSRPLRTWLEVDYKIETRVVVAEVCLVLPGLPISGGQAGQWGLDRLLAESDFGAAGDLDTQPFRRSEVDREAVVLAPSRSDEDVLAACRRMYDSRRVRTRQEVEGEGRATDWPVGEAGGRPPADPAPPPGRYGVTHRETIDFDRIEFRSGVVDDRVQLYYLPLWRLSLAFRGRHYDAFVDGARGRLVSLEVPVGGRAWPWELLINAGVGGQACGLYLAWLAHARHPHDALLHGVGSAFFLAWAWRCVRMARGLDWGPLPATRVVTDEDLSP